MDDYPDDVHLHKNNIDLIHVFKLAADIAAHTW